MRVAPLIPKRYRATAQHTRGLHKCSCSERHLSLQLVHFELCTQLHFLRRRLQFVSSLLLQRWTNRLGSFRCSLTHFQKAFRALKRWACRTDHSAATVGRTRWREIFRRFSCRMTAMPCLGRTLCLLYLLHRAFRALCARVHPPLTTRTFR